MSAPDPVIVPPLEPLEAAVINPLALTVIFALVNAPTFELTVAKVVVIVVAPYNVCCPRSSSNCRA